MLAGRCCPRCCDVYISTHIHQYIHCVYFLAFRLIFTNYCHLYLFVDTSQLAQLGEHMEGEQKGMARLLTKWQLSVLPHLLGRSY